MRKLKFVFLTVITLSLVFTYIPSAIPQSGTYTFHGVVGNKIFYKVTTFDSASMNNLFVGETPSNYNLAVGDQIKYDINAVSMNILNSSLIEYYNFYIYYSTNGTFNSQPDNVLSFKIFYSPENLTNLIQSEYNSNVSWFSGFQYLRQLPTPVDQYLQNIAWAPGCKADGNTIVFNMSYFQNWWQPDGISQYYNMSFLKSCTLTYTYDKNSGNLIDTKFQANSSKIIYEIAAENNSVPGFSISTFIGSIFVGVIAMTLVLNKKFHQIDEKKINKSSSNF